MGRSRLQIAQNQIVRFFELEDKHIYKRADILTILSDKREQWNLASSMSTGQFFDYLKQINILREYEMKFPHRKERRFIRGVITEYELIQSLRPTGYFTHYTALELHRLVDKRPKTIYLNCEQLPKYRLSNELMQERIDLAFRNKCRVSRNVARTNGRKVCLLNGKHTGCEGVTSIVVGSEGEVRVTNIERTLIDCTVRPVYSGGVRNVVRAFELAATKVNISFLLHSLSTLDYLYPYHQAIGFYLERSAVYAEDQISVVESIPKTFDFYLAHNMKNPRYSKRWRLYYPRSF